VRNEWPTALLFAQADGDVLIVTAMLAWQPGIVTLTAYDVCGSNLNSLLKPASLELNVLPGPLAALRFEDGWLGCGLCDNMGILRVLAFDAFRNRANCSDLKACFAGMLACSLKCIISALIMLG